MEQNFKSDLFKELAARLVNYGLSVQLLDEETAGVPTLRCVFQLPGNPGEPLIMDMSFYDINTAPVMQFFIYVHDKTDKKTIAALKETVDDANSFIPAGHFGYYGDDNVLYYRYCVIFSENDSIDTSAERCESTIEMMFTILDDLLPKFKV